MPKGRINTPIKNQSLGELLRQSRRHKKLEISQVSESTKIRAEFITALEKGDYDTFASSVYAKGFLRNYAKLLGLEVDKVLALYRREQDDQPVRRDLALEQKKQFSIIDQLLSKRGLTATIALLLTLLVLYYLAIQVSALLQPPYLEIIAPIQATADYSGDVTVAEGTFQVTGTTAPQTVVRLNGELLQLKSGYTFSTDPIPLSDDVATVQITATNQFGRIATIDLKIERGTTTGQTDREGVNVLIAVENDITTLLVRADGVIDFNDRAFPGDVISINADRRIQIETQSPDNLKVTINGETFTLLSSDQTWELIDGNVVEK